MATYEKQTTAQAADNGAVYRLRATNSIGTTDGTQSAALTVIIPLATKVKIGANDWRQTKSAKVKVGTNDWRNIKTAKVKIGTNDWRTISIAPPPPLPTVTTALPATRVKIVNTGPTTFTASATNKVAQNWQYSSNGGSWVNSTQTGNTYTTGSLPTAGSYRYKLRAKNYLNQYAYGGIATLTVNPLIVELVTNGDFKNSNGTGWVFSGGTQDFSNQNCKFYNGGGGYKTMKQTITGLATGTYTFKLTRLSGSGLYTSLSLGKVDNGTEYHDIANILAIGTYTKTISVNASTLYIRIQQGSCSTCNSTGIFDNISLIKV